MQNLTSWMVLIYVYLSNERNIMKKLLFFIILPLLLTSCDPVKRHAKLVERYPYVHKDSTIRDTVKIVDTVTILTPTYHFDTIILRDTFTIENERLKLVYKRINDTTFIDVDCKGDTVYIPVEKTIIKEKNVVHSEQPKKRDYAWVLWVLLLAFIIGFFISSR